MTQHHVSEEYLLAYAAGDLDEGTSLFVATHLALCPTCRRAVSVAEDMGGALVEDIAPVTMEYDAFDHVMARLERPVQDALKPSPREYSGRPVLPEPLRSRVGGDVDGVSWRRVGPGVRQLRFDGLEGESSLRLLRIAGGTAVPEHGHRGDEMTLVLAGSFKDGVERFARGDVECADPSIVHRPVAEEGDDCICLAVTSAPLKFFDLFGRLAQPFARI
jgi:putative transcriptional regulator